MSKTTCVTVTLSPVANKRFEALCQHYGLSKSRCIEDIINRQYFELEFKEGVKFNLDSDSSSDSMEVSHEESKDS